MEFWFDKEINFGDNIFIFGWGFKNGLVDQLEVPFVLGRAEEKRAKDKAKKNEEARKKEEAVENKKWKD